MVWCEHDKVDPRDIDLLLRLGINVYDRSAYGWRKAAKQAETDANAACHDIPVFMWLKRRQYALERACWVSRQQGRW